MVSIPKNLGSADNSVYNDNAGHQKVSGCSTKGDSQGTQHICLYQNVNKAGHSDFEIQKRRHHENLEQGFQWSQKEL